MSIDTLMHRLYFTPFMPGARTNQPDIGLHQLELAIGAQLPPDYRHFLRHYGGITFHVDVIADCLDQRIEDGFVAIEGFFGFYIPQAAPAYDLLRNYTESRATLPPLVFPIALCPYGNQLLLNIGTGSGVLFVDHEEYSYNPDWSESMPDGVYVVQPSFSMLIATLKPFPAN